MASNFKLGTTARNAAANGIVDRLDSGAGAGKIELRDDSGSPVPPTNPGDASNGVLLANIPLNDPAFDDAAAGVASLDTSPAVSASAVASGTAGYFRAYADGAADTACEFQGTAGINSGTFDLEFDNATIVSGGTVTISGIDITVPEQ